MKRIVLLLAAAVLAGACTDTKEPPVAAGSSLLADSADQVMYGVRSILTDQGLRRGELLADTAYLFEEGTRTEMLGVTTTFFTPSGAKDGVLTSREGTYNTRLNTMEARRNVVVVTVDGRRLETSQLRYDQAKNEISSDSAFVLTEPGRRLEGIGFVSDPDMRNVRILQTKGGTTGAVTIPGQ